jgi:hypothetical protein
MLLESQHLVRRRQQLIDRCAQQREEMIIHSHSLSHSMSALDTVMGYLQRIKQHPGWIIGLIIGVIAIRPTRLSALMQGSAVALRTWRTVAPILQNLRRYY